MAFVYVEDKYFSIECVIFPKVYNEFSYLINSENIVIIKGVLKKEEDQVKVLVRNIVNIEEVNRFKLYILVNNINNISNYLEKFKSLVIGNEGDVRVYFYSQNERKSFKLNKEYNIKLSNKVIIELDKLFSEDSVKIVITDN